MDKYGVRIEIQDGEVESILDELTAAQETIRRCYNRLTDLGVLVVMQRAASDD